MFQEGVRPLGSVKFNMDGWQDKVKKALEGNYVTRVGILGDKASAVEHEGVDLTNAEIGAIHELGLLAHVPERSFLRMPLEAKLGEWIEHNLSIYRDCLKKGDMKHWFDAVGFAAEKIIDDAFMSGGFGSWPRLAPSTVAMKGGRRDILMDTGQLRASITSAVYERALK